MKNIIVATFLALFSIAANAQNAPTKKLTTTTKVSTSSTTKMVLKNETVDIACGECQFNMKGKDCELAVKINGKSYFVDGKGIDDFGDAHAKNGFCNAVSKAMVSGQVVNNRFKATEIKLLPKEK